MIWAVVGLVFVCCVLLVWIEAQIRRAPRECVNCQAHADGRQTIVRTRRYRNGRYALCTSCWLVFRRSRA